VQSVDVFGYIATLRIPSAQYEPTVAVLYSGGDCNPATGLVVPDTDPTQWIEVVFDWARVGWSGQRFSEILNALTSAAPGETGSALVKVRGSFERYADSQRLRLVATELEVVSAAPSEALAQAARQTAPSPPAAATQVPVEAPPTREPAQPAPITSQQVAPETDLVSAFRASAVGQALLSCDSDARLNQGITPNDVTVLMRANSTPIMMQFTLDDVLGAFLPTQANVSSRDTDIMQPTVSLSRIAGELASMCGERTAREAASIYYYFVEHPIGRSLYGCVSNSGRIEMAAVDGTLLVHIEKYIGHLLMQFRSSASLGQLTIINAGYGRTFETIAYIYSQFEMAMYLELSCGSAAAAQVFPDIYNTMRMLNGIR